MKKIIYTLSLSLLFSTGYAQSQGPNNPAAVTEQAWGCLSCPGSDWMNMTNVYTANGMETDAQLNGFPACFQSNCFYTRSLWTTDFGFTVPLSATITGVVVEIKERASFATSIWDSTVRLLMGTVEFGTNHAASVAWSTTSGYVTYGTPTDLWGAALTPAIVNAAGFGVALKVWNQPPAIQNAYVDHIRVTVYYSTTAAAPIANFLATPAGICAGGNVSFIDSSLNNPTSWNWSFPGGNPSSSSSPNPVVNYSTPGVYDVTLIVSNATGSDTLTDSSLIIVYALPVPSITQQNDSLICNPFAAYQWYDSSALIAGANGQVYVISHSGNYSVTVTDTNGCSSSDTIAAIYTSAPLPEKNSIQIFSNGKEIICNCNSDCSGYVTVLNILGQEIQNEKISDSKQISFGKIPPGIYLVSWFSAKEKFVRKIFIE